MKVVDDKKWTWHSFFFYKKSLELCGKLFENILKRPLTAACEYLRIKERIFEIKPTNNAHIRRKFAEYLGELIYMALNIFFNEY